MLLRQQLTRLLHVLIAWGDLLSLAVFKQSEESGYTMPAKV